MQDSLDPGCARRDPMRSFLRAVATAVRHGVLAAITLLVMMPPASNALGAPLASPAPEPLHVVVVFLDGPRHSETWGSRQRIPWLAGDLAPSGVVLPEFYNRGTTKTVSGHASVMTGTWQHLRNDGTERPHAPTLFELLRSRHSLPAAATWVVAGKSKIRALSHSDQADFGAAFAACDSVDLGPDTLSCAVLRGALATHAPRLSMANFGDIDIAGHDEHWEGYLTRITRADSLLGVLWHAIERDPQLAGNTALFVTYDHGRHDNRPASPHGGFKDHGDDCHGCRHIALYARGRGIRAGLVSQQPRDMTDLGATIAWMLGLPRLAMTGTPMLELLTDEYSSSAPPEGWQQPRSAAEGSEQ